MKIVTQKFYIELNPLVVNFIIAMLLGFFGIQLG